MYAQRIRQINSGKLLGSTDCTCIHISQRLDWLVQGRAAQARLLLQARMQVCLQIHSHMASTRRVLRPPSTKATAAQATRKRRIQRLSCPVGWWTRKL